MIVTTPRFNVNQIDDYEPEEISIGDTGPHEYYTLLSSPQNPMSTPWTEVLDFSCDWASGQSTGADVAQKITEGIYYMDDKIHSHKPE